MTKLVITLILLFGTAVSARSFAHEAETSFPMRRGINVVGPFVRVKPVSDNSDGQVSDFWTLQKYPGWYTGDELREAGFDFIRLPINPAVLLENPKSVRARLLDEIEDGFRSYISAGLKVIIDLHFWSPPNKTWTEKVIATGTDVAAIERYSALVTDISLRLAQYPHGSVALELLNEPPKKDCKTGWIVVQQLLLRELRKRAPVLPIVVTGCGGQLDGLLAIGPSQIDMTDNNLIYSFHFYDPFLFTHQGGYSQYLYIEGIPYPASDGSVSKTLDITNRAIDKAGLATVDALAAKAGAAKEIAYYFAQAPNRAFVDRRFDQLIAWARANGIASSQILLGEFAAINWRKKDAPEYSAARRQWDEDVKAAAADRGISWTYWNLPYPKGSIFR